MQALKLEFAFDLGNKFQPVTARAGGVAVMSNFCSTSSRLRKNGAAGMKITLAMTMEPECLQPMSATTLSACRGLLKLQLPIQNGRVSPGLLEARRRA